MNQTKVGSLIRSLRQQQGMTQLMLAEQLGVSDKAVSKWERGLGYLSRIRFYVCPECGSWLYTTGGAEMTCCGHQLNPLEVKPADEHHTPAIEQSEDELYLAFSHEMSKTHFIRFAVWVGFDRTFSVQLYPEQEAALRLPHLSGRGTLYLFCSRDGLMTLPL